MICNTSYLRCWIILIYYILLYFTLYNSLKFVFLREHISTINMYIYIYEMIHLCHMRTPVAGDHGLLQIRRTNGEATVPYKAHG